MAHFAQVNNQYTVLQVATISNDSIGDLPFPESEPVGRALCQQLYGVDTLWYQTSYNNSFRVRYAGIGYTYDPVLDAFLTPKPYPSWVLNTQTYDWQAPVPYPNDGKDYYWDEETQSWVVIPEITENFEPPVLI
jgi:hypothetical protein